jgi:subtilisin family serine protease
MLRALTLVFWAALTLEAAAMVSGTADPNVPTWGVVPGVVIVKLKPDVEPAAPRGSRAAVATGMPVLDRVAQEVRATRFDKVFVARHKNARSAPAAGLPDLSRFYRLEFDVVRDPAQVAEEVAKDPQVELAEVVTWHAVDQLIPNDPQFVNQWHLREGTQPTQDNDVDAPEAWTVQTGDPDVKIAIFDTGVLWYHPDLRDQIWVNPGEDLDGDGVVQDPDDVNGVDDDGNGFVDDLTGWDFVAAGTSCAIGEDCTVADNDPRDFNGHGTHVAGIAAAATYNARDGAGVAGGRYPLQRGCLIMPCRAGWATTDGRGAVRTDYVGQGVDYAVANGALVGNLSAGAGTSTVLASALANAFANGFIFTKSAGNDNSNIPDDFDDYGSTIAVVATTKSDTRASYSNYGVWCDISAPGGDLTGPGGIWSTYGANGVASFASLSGTSMAAPLVAGCAALLYANNPFFTKAQIEATLYATCDSIDYLNPGYAHMLGHGRVNVGNAIAALPQAKFGGESVPPPAAAAAAADPAVSLAADTAITGQVPLSVQFTDQSPGSPSSWAWNFGDAGSSTDQNPLHIYTVPGRYDVTLDATQAAGSARKRHQNAVLAHADTNFYANGKNCPGNQRKATAVLYLTNAVPVYTLTLPLTYKGAGDLKLDSFSFAGTRVAYFETLDRPFSSDQNQFSVFTLKANNGGGSPPLAPGSGPILKLYFTIRSNTPVGSLTLNPVDTFTVLNYNYYATSGAGIKYWPEWKLGGIDLLPYCRGDFNLSGAITSSDIILLVNYVFKSGPPSSDPWTMDVDVNGVPTSADIIYLVNHVFKGGPAPK